MTDDENNEQAETIRRLCEVIESRGEAAHPAHTSVEAVAREWLAAGFEDADEVDEWLAAKCFTAEGALSLERAGITPDQAAMLTHEGAAPYEETIAYKIIKGDLSLEEARRIITSAFWNS